MTGIDATKERIADEITAPLAALGFDVEAVELTPAGNRRVLRIAVDKDGGITLDDVADATRGVNAVLDESDVLGQQPYTLEVTSRGVDRPLTLARHWRRNVDRLVKVTPVEGAVFTGRILSSTEETVTFEVAGRQRTVPIDAITKGLVQVEFNRRPHAAGAGEELDADDLDADESDDLDESDEIADTDDAKHEQHEQHDEHDENEEKED